MRAPECNGHDDCVALVALHVLKVFHGQRLETMRVSFSERLKIHIVLLCVLNQLVDQFSLNRV